MLIAPRWNLQGRLRKVISGSQDPTVALHELINALEHDQVNAERLHTYVCGVIDRLGAKGKHVPVELIEMRIIFGGWR